MSMEIEGQSCPRCGISGIHACPGKPLKKPTPEDEARLRQMLKEVSEQRKSDDRDYFNQWTAR